MHKHNMTHNRAKAKEKAIKKTKAEAQKARELDSHYARGYNSGYTRGRDSVIPTHIVEGSRREVIWLGPKEMEQKVYFTGLRGKEDYMYNHCDRPPSRFMQCGGIIHLKAVIKALEVEGAIIKWPDWSVAKIDMQY